MNRLRLTRLLAGMLAGTGAFPSESKSLDWEGLVSVAGRQLVLTSLYTALSEHRRLSHLPPDLVSYLLRVRELNARRNDRILAQLHEIGLLLNGLGVRPVLLKGAAALVSELYGHPGDRFLSDLDLLLPSHRLHACEGLLRRRGYADVSRDGPPIIAPGPRHHLPGMARSGRPVFVELHELVVNPKAGSLPRPADMCLGARLVRLGDAEFMLPSPEARVLHNFAHACLQNNCFELRQLWEFLRLGQAYREMDWRKLAARAKAEGSGHAFLGYHLMSAKLFGQGVPEQVGISMGARWRWWALQAELRVPALNPATLIFRRAPQLLRKATHLQWLRWQWNARRRTWARLISWV